MGMFDTVMFVCPKCRASIEVQSKSGKCDLHFFSQTERAADLERQLAEARAAVSALHDATAEKAHFHTLLRDERGCTLDAILGLRAAIVSACNQAGVDRAERDAAEQRASAAEAMQRLIEVERDKAKRLLTAAYRNEDRWGAAEAGAERMRRALESIEEAGRYGNAYVMLNLATQALAASPSPETPADPAPQKGGRS